MMVRSIRAILYLFLSATTLLSPALAQEKELLTFAIGNAEKFPSEISGLPRTFVLRGKDMSSWWKFAPFDPQAEKMLMPYPINLWSMEIFERCRVIGSYQGPNAFGAKAIVKKMDCQYLEIQDTDSSTTKFGDSGLEIPMSPTMYRDIKANGIIYEVDFEVGPGIKKEVASRSTVMTTPQIDAPSQKKVDFIRVHGTITSVRLLTANGKTRLAEFSR